MDLDFVSLAFVGIVLLGAGMRATFGFADALIAMPLLLLLFDDWEVAAPIMALCSVTQGAVIAIIDRRHIAFRAAWLLVLSSLAGIPLGFLLPALLPEAVVQSVLAILLFLFAVIQYAGVLRWHIDSDRWAPVFGFAGGLLAGPYNTPGPPLVVFASLRQWPAERFRATMQAYSFPTGLCVLLVHAVNGRVTSTVGKYYLLAIPVGLFAIWVGTQINRRIAKRGFDRYVYFLLMIISLSLLAKVGWQQWGS